MDQHRFDADLNPDPTCHFDADLNPTPSFTNVGKSEIFYLLKCMAVPVHIYPARQRGRLIGFIIFNIWKVSVHISKNTFASN